MAATRTVVPPVRRTGRGTVRRSVDVRAALTEALRVVAARKPLPWLGLVGTPLAITAALASDVWWALVPLGVCAWWWSPRVWGWEWLVALQTGAVGAAWATLGAVSLGTWPQHRAVIGAVWIGSAVVLAAVSAAGRRAKVDG